MKKALLMAACLMLAGVFLVNGTLAADFSKAVSEVFTTITDLLDKAQPETGNPSVDVELVSDDTPQQIFPGSAAAVRSSAVKNQGEAPVYFRLAYAVQYDAETWNKLTIGFTAENGYAESGWKDIVVSGTPYRMKVFTYTNTLAAGSTSPKVEISISMDTSVTSQQLARYRSDFLQIQALAVETEVFAGQYPNATAEDVLNLALPLEGLNPF